MKIPIPKELEESKNKVDALLDLQLRKHLATGKFFKVKAKDSLDTYRAKAFERIINDLCKKEPEVIIAALKESQKELIKKLILGQ